MGKASRRTHVPPRPASKEIRIQLTPREAKDLQGLCAVAALQLIALRQEVTERTAAAQRPHQQEMARLAKKYAKAGMRADADYTLDPATHALVEVRPDGTR